MPEARAISAPLLSTGAGSKKVKLDQAAFGTRFHGPLVHQSVRAEQAARRRGTASTKTRGMVSGGGAKPWRQKGTGRARAGSSRSPLWSGGGVVFGPQPRSYTFKVNRKEQRAALRSALSLHAQRGSIAVFDASAFKAPKTRQARELLEAWDQPRPTLVVLGEEESAAAFSFRNLARIAVLRPQDVGVADIVGACSLLVSETALQALTARAGTGAPASESEAPVEAATTSARAKTAAKPAAAREASATSEPSEERDAGAAEGAEGSEEAA